MNITTTSLKTKTTKRVSKGISKESQPEVYEISKAINSIDIPEPEPITEENLDIQTLVFLEQLGCTVVDGYDKDTTLLDDNEDVIENPNIKSNNIIKNKKKGTDKSFPNEDDPFYEIDKQLPQSRTNSRSIEKTSSNAKKVRSLVIDIASLNTKSVPGIQTLKQFGKLN